MTDDGHLDCSYLKEPLLVATCDSNETEQLSFKSQSDISYKANSLHVKTRLIVAGNIITFP